MKNIIDYTHETGDIASQGLGKQYRSIHKVGRGKYLVYFADLSQECKNPGDQAYKCPSWQGLSDYTTAELRKSGFNFKKPNLFLL